MTISQNLKDLRRLSGLTQEQVAEKVGLTRQAISSYESGRTQPDLAMLEKLAAVYGVELTDVLYGAGQRHRALRFWRRAPFVLVGLVLAVVLLRSWSFWAVSGGLPESAPWWCPSWRSFTCWRAPQCCWGICPLCPEPWQRCSAWPSLPPPLRVARRGL